MRTFGIIRYDRELTDGGAIFHEEYSLDLSDYCDAKIENL